MGLKWYERVIGFLIFGVFVISFFYDNIFISNGINIATFILVAMVMIRIYVADRKRNKRSE